MSYKRAGKMIRQLEVEVEVLTRKADEVDSVPLEDGLVLPTEIKRRADRKAALEKARHIIEERYEKEQKEKQAEYEAKKNSCNAQRKNGTKTCGKES